MNSRGAVGKSSTTALDGVNIGIIILFNRFYCIND